MTIYEQVKKGLQNSLEELSRRNEELATGKRILKPSDDITSSSRALGYKVEISIREQYLRNMATGDLQFEFTDNVLSSLSNTLLELRKLTISGVNPQDQQARLFNSQQARLLRDHLYELSNTRHLGRFIFSGMRTDREAFVYNPLTHTYEYQGDLGEMSLPLNSNSLVGINIPGSEVFSPVLRNSAPSSLSDGTSVIYTESKDPVTGVNTITIEIGDPMSAEHDVFTVTNIMDIANRLSYAWQYEDIDSSFIGETKAMHRIEALQSLIDDARTQVLEKQTELATRRQFLKDAEERTKNLLNTLKKSLSLSEDANLTEVAIEIQKAQTGLEALRISSIKLLSTTLLDFLK
jgi:flagellar hook-associated protein 3